MQLSVQCKKKKPQVHPYLQISAVMMFKGKIFDRYVENFCKVIVHVTGQNQIQVKIF